MKSFTQPATQSCCLLLKKIMIGCCLLAGPVIITQAQPTVSVPASTSICTGSNVSFTVTATGSGPLTYQWQESEDGGATWGPVFDNTSSRPTPTTGVYTGTGTPTLTITRVPSTMDQYLYDVIVTDKNGFTTTSTAALLGVGPNISLDDQPKSGCPASNVTFNTPLVSGVSYQWQVSSNNGTSWANIPNGTDPSGSVYAGVTTNNLTISNLAVSLNNNLYRYLANNGLGCNVTSGNITLGVPALAVVVNPGNAIVDASNNATFTVAVTSGSAPYSYHWTVSTNGGVTYANLTDNATYSGSLTNTLNITNATAAMYNYLYRPVVRNSGNCATTGINFAKLAVFTALPVELASFTAKKQGNSAVSLQWTVGGQYAPQSYTVQRSGNGLDFTDIGLIKGATGKISFGFTDGQPGDGVIQYRLKIADKDGNPAYSTVVSVTLDGTANRIEMRPSVTMDGNTNLYMTLAQNDAIILTVMDVTGRLELSQSVRLEKGENYIPLNISRLSKGIYYVHITSNDGISKTLSLIKD
jgi:hypothetical protein